jgi:activator of HSP90 ATPase
MAKTIVQKLVFKNTTPTILYNLYMDAKLHKMIAGGAPATISAKEGAKYSVHGGYIEGKNLQLVKDKLIVQTWRGKDWDKDDVDSTFSIYFEPKGKDVLLLATHANVPDKHAEHLTKGWHDNYWKPWKQYLAGKEITRPKM